MDIPNSIGRSGFWEAYRACAVENRVASIHLSGASSPGVPGIEHYQKRIEASTLWGQDQLQIADFARLAGPPARQGMRIAE
jgi:hypothetical protein